MQNVDEATLSSIQDEVAWRPVRACRRWKWCWINVCCLVGQTLRSMGYVQEELAEDGQQVEADLTIKRIIAHR